MKRHGISIGGFTDQILKNYHIVRFINKNDIPLCEKGTFLVGSIKRNKNFADERNDKGEISVTISWENKMAEKWHFTDEECCTYLGGSVEDMAQRFGLRNHKEFSSITGTGGLMLKNNPLMYGNLLSLSLSLIPRDIAKKDKLEIAQKIKNSIGMPDNAVLLELKKPDALIKSVTRKIMASGHLEVSVTPICGRVNYDDRIV
ncbi:MAG: hypothetical protein GY829_11820, partial [Gammaproteobacteria bacterium]|nr:hypothetical protein [Gammaproteobacteria bacterium]